MTFWSLSMKVGTRWKRAPHVTFTALKASCLDCSSACFPATTTVFVSSFLQDSFGQHHVVEVLTEEVEEGRSASSLCPSSDSITFSLSTLRTHSRKLLKRREENAYLVCHFQFGVIGRAGGHRMERYSSAVQWGGKEEASVSSFLGRIICWGIFFPRLKVTSIVLQKMLLRYYMFEGLRFIWLDTKGAFCRVRYWNRETRNLWDLTEYWATVYLDWDCFNFWMDKKSTIFCSTFWLITMLKPSISVCSVLNEDWTCKDLYGFQKGLSHLKQSLRLARIHEWRNKLILNLRGCCWVIGDVNAFRRRVYGPNLIDVPVKPYMKLLFEEVRRTSLSVFFMMALSVKILLEIWMNYQIEPTPYFCFSLYLLL